MTNNFGQYKLLGTYCPGIKNPTFLNSETWGLIVHVLTEEVEHHPAVSAGGVGACKGLARVLVCHHGAVYIFHGIDGYLVGLSEQGLGEILQDSKSLGNIPGFFSTLL